MEIKSLPLYEKYFPNPFDKQTLEVDWNAFRSTGKSLTAPLSKCPVDFSIRDHTCSWREVAKKVFYFILKVILFPWGLYVLTRYVVQRVVMMFLYPAQSRIVRWFNAVNIRDLDAARKRVASCMNAQGYVVRHIVLEKNGVRYSGLLVGHENTITNGRWVLQALGNFEFIEFSAEKIAPIYRGIELNTLFINGPAVGRSEGEANPTSMGDAQEIGLSFLEIALKANNIVIAGRSLGGAAIGEAIMKHQFKRDVHYIGAFQMTFDSVSNIFNKIIRASFSKRFGRFMRRVVRWCGSEMDTMRASKKLQQLGIEEIIIQTSNKEIQKGVVPHKNDFCNDGVICARASHGYRLVKKGIVDKKRFCCLFNGRHMTDEAFVATREAMQNIFVSV